MPAPIFPRSLLAAGLMLLVSASSAPANGATVGSIRRACASCHGARGEGRSGTAIPRLAGQRQDYLEQQLRNFADGLRPHPASHPDAARLTPADVRRIAASYARASPPPLWQLPAPTPDQLARGRTLAMLGDPHLKVPACIGCHADPHVKTGKPITEGTPRIAYSNPLTPVPRLSGQPRTYMIVAMVEWGNGIRHADPTGAMNRIMAALNHDDLEALAAFYGAQSTARHETAPDAHHLEH